MDHIDSLLREAAEAIEVPGAVAVAVTADRTLYQGAFGVRDLSAGASMTADTVFWIASMTKALTSVAAMQLVEQGRLSLDQDAGEIVPALAGRKVLEGFAEDGSPILRPARRPVTLRHLLTHTAGFTYEFLHADTGRYMRRAGLSRNTGLRASVDTPLAFDPGERWEYGVNTDWLGFLVEEASGLTLNAYLRKHVTGPLGMDDTDFLLTPERRARLARVHNRGADGSLTPTDFETNQSPEFFSGGGGLYGTAPDYGKFLRAMLDGGGGVLRPETVATMALNHVGDLPAGVMTPAMPQLTNTVDLFAGSISKWGLGFLLNTIPVRGGRSVGSLAWAGLANTYYWIDLKRGVAGVIMMQILPFGDAAAIRLLQGFERAVYAAI